MSRGNQILIKIALTPVGMQFSLGISLKFTLKILQERPKVDRRF